MYYLHIEYESNSSSSYESLQVFSTLAEALSEQAHYVPTEDDEFYSTHIYQELPDYLEYLLLDKYTPRMLYPSFRW